MTDQPSTNLPSIIDFFFEESQVRTVFNTATNEGYVCLSDLLKAQNSSTWPHQVLPEIEAVFGEGQKIVLPLDTPGGMQDVIFISEHAVAFIVSRGRTETSKRLNRWLFTEVLPAIRRTGCYIAPGADVMLAIERERSERYLAESALKDRLIEAVEGKAAAWEKVAALEAKNAALTKQSPKTWVPRYRLKQKMTPEMREEILSLKKQGQRNCDIARRVDRSMSTIRNVLRDAGYKAEQGGPASKPPTKEASDE